MKKRKELDALVTNGSRAKLSNNKKKSMPSHKEEGHELLLNIESDSGSSLDLDFSPPKRTFVRKPHVCSLCLSGCVLILLVASLLMSITLLWMNFDLKKDVDGLRKRLELVEKESGISKSQLDSSGALINGLEKNINDTRDRLKENVQRMDLKILDINNKVVELNTSSLALKNKVQSLMPKQPATAEDPQLQMVVAGLGSEVEELKGTVQDVQSSQKLQQEDIQSLSKNVANLQTTVSGMSSAKPTGMPGRSQSVPTPMIPVEGHITKAPNSTQVTASTAVASYLEQELRKLSDTITAVNASLNALEHEHINFSNRLQNVELMTQNIPLGLQAVNSTVTLVDILKLQSDVKTLMAQTANVNTSISTGEVTPHDIMTMHAQIAVLQLTVDSLTDKLDQLSSSGLNNNLLNMNTTLGIQTIMTNSLKHFKDENIENLDNVRFSVSQLKIQTQQQQEAIDHLEGQLLEMHQLVVASLNPNIQGLVTNQPISSLTNTSTVSRTNGQSAELNTTVANTSKTVTESYEGIDAATAGVAVVTPTAPSAMTDFNETFEDVTLPPPPLLGYLSVPGVNTIDDVKARFSIWNMNTGYVSFQDMANFLGPGFKGTEQLEQFDYDQDSLLSEAEIIAAFGFQNVHNRRRIGDDSLPTGTTGG